jgi:NADH-quinone oxidoreductase subunit G
VPRPERETITFSIDGREVRAPENIMLADGAKYGDIEIPVFCYEPKLGSPVGACRMCLVEIEGIPKLQTACSTAVKDGMVVHTQTARVKEAQEAIVEFLLINHPLDCPVCDKGGECPLQDISFGWGGGRSRFIEPKRHFQKPLELSPLIAIDRERCILCYRCVRFSQEISEDYQLILLDRGAHTFVGTFDGHPYVGPFSGNIVELCPVGALTSTAYRFRARPWDIEGAGSLCTLCPSQCNTSLTVRDDRLMRVLARQHDGVDDGWLCDKGRFAYQVVHSDERVTQPMVRGAGGDLEPASWDEALDRATDILRAAGNRAAGLAGSGATNEEGLVLGRLLRDGLGSPHLDSRPRGAVDADQLRRLAAPRLQATVPDLEFAHGVLVLDCEPIDEAPIFELRIRKGVRRNRVKLGVATSRPSALDPIAAASARFAPGHVVAFLEALSAALEEPADGGPASGASAGGGSAGGAAAGGSGQASSGLDELAAAAGAQAVDLRALAGALRGEEIVILYGERLLDAGGGAGGDWLLEIAAQLGVAETDGAGLLGIPDGTNGRGLREVGVLPNAGPGFSDVAGGLDAPGIAGGLAAGELAAVYLLSCDPVRSHPDQASWMAGLAGADGVIAHAMLLTEGIRAHASVVFPGEAAAEKEGTVTHPDGRIQRLRPAIGRPGEVRAEWAVLCELARRLGHDLGLESARDWSSAVFAAVPFYAGLTLEELGGRGLRWQVREQAAGLGDVPAASRPTPTDRRSSALGSPGGRLLLGSYRSIWAAAEVEVSPALKFLTRHQRVEISAADAARLGLSQGEAVLVFSDDDRRVRCRVEIRNAVPVGSAFLESGIHADSAESLKGPLVRIHRSMSPNGAGGHDAMPARTGA